MASPPSAPPTYNESMQQNPPGAYASNYGAMNPPAPPYPTGGAYDPSKPGYDPSKPGGYYPQQPGYPTSSPPGQVPSYQQTHQQNIVVHPTQSVVVVGGCPACRVGVLEEDFTCCGVLCAILFFPLGILCCLAMRQRRCANCGAVFG